MSEHLTPEDIELVKAKYGMSKDVQRLSAGGSILGNESIASCPVQPQTKVHVTASGASSDYEPATDIRPSKGGKRKTRFQSDSARETAKLERGIGNGTVVQIPIQTRLGKRFRVRVTSFRKRLLDDDNLCEKYHIDLCRYSGVIPSDAPGTTKIEVAQQKVESNEAERVLIEVFEV